MPSGRVTPNYKFRLLCKRCNSYLFTGIELQDGALALECQKCGNTARDLNEAEGGPNVEPRSDRRPG